MGDNLSGKRPIDINLLTPVDPDSPTLPGAGSTAPRPRYHPLRDMWLGAAYGARTADILGPLGIFAWILTGFVPVLGTVVALRDAQFAWKIRDWWSLFFNLLGLLPFVEGFATLAILARLRRYHHVLHSAHQVAHVARRGRALGAAGNRAARSTVITGAAHGAGAIASVRRGDTGPIRENRTAWPAFIFGLLLLLVLPTFAGLAIAANLNSTGLLQLLPLPFLIALTGVVVFVSFASLLLARHARQVSRRLQESGGAHPIVSLLAVICTRIAFVIALGAAALIIYGEWPNILPR
jgi:hypothetical protein